MKKNNIVLIGFMGCGKTVVSDMVSRLTGRRATDTDDEIEKTAGMSIPHIFEKYGEDYFRRLEAEIVRDTASKKNRVIATGGGIIKNPENIRCLKENGVVFYLQATPEKLFGNTADSQHRPLLNIPDRMAGICSMLAEREPLYLRYADHIIQTSELGVMEVAKAVIHQYQNL